VLRLASRAITAPFRKICLGMPAIMVLAVSLTIEKFAIDLLSS